MSQAFDVVVIGAGGHGLAFAHLQLAQDAAFEAGDQLLTPFGHEVLQRARRLVADADAGGLQARDLAGQVLGPDTRRVRRLGGGGGGAPRGR